MEWIRDFFDGKSPWLNIIFFSLAVIGIILTLYFFFKSKKDKRPVINSKTFQLFTASPLIKNKLEIKYDGRSVDKILLTKIAFWNAGREAIRKDDIAIKDALIIHAPNNTIIYDFEIIDQNQANGFFIEKINEHELRIIFDYINFNDGILLNIFHSDLRSEKIKVTGSFIGANKLVEGFKEDKLLLSVDWVARPVNKYLNKSGLGNRILLVLIFIPTIVIFLILFLILSPIDKLMNYSNRPIKKYIFD